MAREVVLGAVTVALRAVQTDSAVHSREASVTILSQPHSREGAPDHRRSGGLQNTTVQKKKSRSVSPSPKLVKVETGEKGKVIVMQTVESKASKASNEQEHEEEQMPVDARATTTSYNSNDAEEEDKPAPPSPGAPPPLVLKNFADIEDTSAVQKAGALEMDAEARSRVEKIVEMIE